MSVLTDDGKPEALQLSLACFTADMTMYRFERLSAEEQVAFAQGAGLDALGLIKAFRYLGAYLNAQHQCAPTAATAGNPHGTIN